MHIKEIFDRCGKGGKCEEIMGGRGYIIEDTCRICVLNLVTNENHLANIERTSRSIILETSLGYINTYMAS